MESKTKARIGISMIVLACVIFTGIATYIFGIDALKICAGVFLIISLIGFGTHLYVNNG